MLALRTWASGCGRKGKAVCTDKDLSQMFWLLAFGVSDFLQVGNTGLLISKSARRHRPAQL